MNEAMFWRIVWKEYRQQWSLWLAIAGLTVFVQWMVLASTVLAQDRLPAALAASWRSFAADGAAGFRIRTGSRSCPGRWAP